MASTEIDTNADVDNVLDATAADANNRGAPQDLFWGNAKVWTSASDGAGSLLDADKLDDLDSSKFLRIDQNGNITGNLGVTGTLGVGTTSPVARLEVQINSSTSGVVAQLGNIDGSSPDKFVEVYAFGAGAADSYNGVTAANQTGLRSAPDSSAFVIGAGGGHPLVFSTNGAERMRIKTGGTGIGIGTTSTGNILTIQQSSDTDPIADGWTTYSSQRWKKDVRTIEGALETTQRLRGVTYQWKVTGQADIGLIAEEVGQVVPEVVQYESNGVDARSIDYARLVPILIEAIKQQQAELNALQQNHLEQEERLSRLESRLTLIEAEADS